MNIIITTKTYNKLIILLTVTAVRLRDCTFTWDSPSGTDENRPSTLQDITMDVTHGELVAVVGVVGSGKSSLISAMLGDMIKLRGTAATSVSIR